MSKKLSKEARRDQLLDVALRLVETEGTGGLTLARVADLAGVTKPIAYEHFETREGLLLALFRRFDKKTEEAVMNALSVGSDSAGDALDIIARTYVGCFVSAGRAFGAILNALAASPVTQAIRLDWRDELAVATSAIFGKRGGSANIDPQSALIGLFGAAEALSEHAAAGRLTEEKAAAMLSHLLQTVLIGKQ